jgi:serine/threonine protein kinase
MTLPDPLFLDLQLALAGEYSLERELGRGGMGIVYLAREVQLDRLVAIKVLPPERVTNESTRLRFLREARTAAQLFHPNIVPIYRVGEVADIPYFVMAYVEGETLGERLRRQGPMRATAVSTILRDVGLALGYAHSRGVVHRDIKPDNILLERDGGRALVSDFGIASRVDDDLKDVFVAGTAAFMSPEQLSGQTVDGRADLYALGVVAHLALSGELPAERMSQSQHSLAQAPAAQTSLARNVRDVSPDLVRVVDTCLEFDVARRWANAELMINALEVDRVERPKLPSALREWARSRSWLTTMLPAYLISPELGNLSGSWFWQRTALLAAAPFVGIGLVRLIKTRSLLLEGHSLGDLRHALRARDTSDDKTGKSPMESRGRRVLRALTLAALGTSALSAIGVFVFGYNQWTGQLNTTLPSIFSMPRALVTTLFNVQLFSFYAGAWGSVLLATFGAGILPPKAERRLFGSWRERFWTSRAGAWIVGILKPRTQPQLATAFRPTEVAVAIAADDLFAALPTAYRENLSEVPAVLARLTTRATKLRDEVETMSNLLRQQGAQGEATLGESVRRSREQLAETVSALERIRLDLLRLHGGLADLQPITTTLNAAAMIGADINRLRAAQREVGFRTPLPIDRRTPTPA